MLFSPNCIEWEIACFGISKAGGVFVPMNPILREGEVEYQVTDAQEETMIVHESVYPVVKSIRDKNRTKEDNHNREETTRHLQEDQRSRIH